MLLLQLIIKELGGRILIIVKDSSDGLDPTYKIDLLQLNNFPLLCTKSGMLVIRTGWSECLQTRTDQPVMTKIEKEQHFVMNDKLLSGNLIWSN